MPSVATTLVSHKKKIDALAKKVAAQKQELAALKKCCKTVEKWIKLEVKWSEEVTRMLRQVNWAQLATAYPGGPGSNPPRTPPDWPPT